MTNILNTRFFDAEMKEDEELKEELATDELIRRYKEYILGCIKDPYTRMEYIEAARELHTLIPSSHFIKN